MKQRIQAALNKWTVSEITNGYYRFNDIDDKDLKLINYLGKWNYII